MRIQPSSLRVLGSATLVLVLVLAWWWPGLTERGVGSNVTVIGTGEIGKARDEVSRRIREMGLSVQWVDSVSTWCEASTLLEKVSTQVIVIAPDDLRTCPGADGPIDGMSISPSQARRLVMISLQSSSIVEDLSDKGARRVPTGRLIGASGEQKPCVWWEDCPMSGTVVTRIDSGLTDVGRQRLARLIAAQVS